MTAHSHSLLRLEGILTPRLGGPGVNVHESMEQSMSMVMDLDGEDEDESEEGADESLSFITGSDAHSD